MTPSYGFTQDHFKGLEMLVFSSQGVIGVLLLCTTPAWRVLGSRYAIPGPTLAVVRPAKIHLETHTTISSWNPNEILRRTDGNPEICGWIDGNSSKSRFQPFEQSTNFPNRYASVLLPKLYLHKFFNQCWLLLGRHNLGSLSRATLYDLP